MKSTLRPSLAPPPPNAPASLPTKCEESSGTLKSGLAFEHPPQWASCSGLGGTALGLCAPLCARLCATDSVVSARRLILVRMYSCSPMMCARAAWSGWEKGGRAKRERERGRGRGRGR
eukprot:3516947-Rhodomonas_salina.1